MNYEKKDLSRLSKERKNVTKPYFSKKQIFFEVYQIINSLPKISSEDCYGLHSLLPKVVSPVLCDLLADQFNRCFDENEFPEVLKLASLLQFHKSGDRKDADNFRPISLLPILQNFWKKLFKRIKGFLNANNVISPNHYKYRIKRSTIEALA